MKKVWEWVKKNWKWLLLPLTAIVVVLLWLFGWRKPPKDDVDSGTTDAAADKAVEDTAKAQEEKETAIKELEEKHTEKLEAMSEEQKAEYKKVREQDIDEVAKWIDNLS